MNFFKIYFSVFLFVFTLIFQAAAANAQQAQKPLKPADIFSIANVSDARISPDGSQIVYSVSTIANNKSKRTLWIASGVKESSANMSAAPLLPDDWNASSPRWSPDGKWIAFQANHNQQSGIWVVSARERAPRFVAEIRSISFFIPYEGESFAWSPDSRRIAFITAAGDGNNAAATADDDPRVIDRIQYKTRTSYSDRLHTHVWIADFDPNSDKRAVRQLTSGNFNDHAMTWNPGGNEIAFLSNHEADPDANNNSDIFAVDLSGRVRQITVTRGCEYNPSWSPDGKLIAYIATKRAITTIDSIAEDAHLWVIDAQEGGGQGRELTASQDRRARAVRWTPDSRSILYTANDRGATTIFRISPKGGQIQALRLNRGNNSSAFDAFFENVEPPVKAASSIPEAPRKFQISDFSVAESQPAASGSSTFSLALALGDETTPAEVWKVSGSSGKITAARLSRHNDNWLNSVKIVRPEEFSYRSFDGTVVHGWLMKPADFREGQKYPLLFNIHGGPHSTFGYSISTVMQIYAGSGYAVLYINPRGTNGYGQKFSDGTIGDWGGGDYKDLMLGVDEALRKNSWIDKNRLGVTGGSYGGYMTDWIITQTPRFKAAVTQADVSNLVSFYGTSLYQDLIHAEFGGVPFNNYDLLWSRSPLRYVNKAQTPTLFIHGEQDNDVPITQSEEMYMALRRHGVETVFVRYPREGHGLGEPAHRLDNLERAISWFDRFLK